MRKIKYLEPVPVKLNLSSSTNRKNRIANIRAILSSTEDTASLNFPGYGDMQIKQKIRNLADGCCAYCGIRANLSSTIQVEHYRPKADLKFRRDECRIEGLELQPESRSGVFSKKVSPKNYGYVSWGDDNYNLFPACRACNTGEGNW